MIDLTVTEVMENIHKCTKVVDNMATIVNNDKDWPMRKANNKNVYDNRLT